MYLTKCRIRKVAHFERRTRTMGKLASGLQNHDEYELSDDAYLDVVGKRKRRYAPRFDSPVVRAATLATRHFASMSP